MFGVNAEGAAPPFGELISSLQRRRRKKQTQSTNRKLSISGIIHSIFILFESRARARFFPFESP